MQSVSELVSNKGILEPVMHSGVSYKAFQKNKGKMQLSSFSAPKKKLCCLINYFYLQHIPGAWLRAVPAQGAQNPSSIPH